MDLRPYTAALAYQRRRLQQLLELDGRFDPDDPLQAFSLRRIAWLEDRIEEENARERKTRGLPRDGTALFLCLKTMLSCAVSVLFGIVSKRG